MSSSSNDSDVGESDNEEMVLDNTEQQQQQQQEDEDEDEDPPVAVAAVMQQTFNSTQESSINASVPPTPSTPNRNRNRNRNRRNDQDEEEEEEGEASVPPTPMGGSGVVPSTPVPPASAGSKTKRSSRRFQLEDSDDDQDNDNDNDVVPSTPANTNINLNANTMRDQDDNDSDDDGNDDNDDNGNGNGNVSVSTPMTGYGSFGGSILSGMASRSRQNKLDMNNELQQQQPPQQPRHRAPILEEEDHAPTQLEEKFIRGTNIVVGTAAETFKSFLQNFISVQESEKAFQKGQKKKRKERKLAAANAAAVNAGPGGGGNGDDNDDDDDSDDSDSDDSFESINTNDSTEETRYVYLDKIRDILFQKRQSNSSSNQNSSDAMTSNATMETTAPFDINARHLYFHSPACQRLYHQLTSYPAEVIPLMDLVAGREMEAMYAQLHDEMEESGDDSDANAYITLHPNDIPLPKIQVRPFNLKSLSHMRALDPNSIDNLLSIRGMVVRTSPIIPDLKVAHFACTICSHSENMTLEQGRISEPTVCPECNIKFGFELVHNRSMFADKQMVRIQETPNEVPAGETPASIVLFAYDDLVDAVRPGDRIEVTGVFRAQARRVNPKISKVKSVYRTYLDVIHFRRVSADNAVVMKDDEEEDKEDKDAGENSAKNRGKGMVMDHVGGKLSVKRVQELETLAQSPDIYDKLVQSLAPSIWELDDVKRGVLCMLFGGNSKRVRKGTAEKKRKKEEKMNDSDDSDMEDEDDGEDEEEAGGSSDTAKLNKRGDINILLCGDPGTSKSQLLSYVHKLSPRGVYTSGKGSSAVGLTASIVRDPETRDLVLESGALVLSDLGICCIDEFDKMSDTTRAILHEAMEQQTVSIAKAGIIATLNARTSILASANPVESRYNPSLSVVENIKLPPTLLSRFDLIYLILDAPNVESDRRLAQHLVGLYYETPNVVQPPLDQSLLRDYIAHARDSIHPELSDLATRELIKAYLDMRHTGSASHGNNGSRTISATPRQLESLVRLSEGIAKMRYSTTVTRSDVQEAVRLMKVATQAAATDPRTGKIDMDMITTGRSTANREMEEALHLSLRELLGERRGSRMAIDDVRRQLIEIMGVQGLKREEVVEALRTAEGDGLIQFNERAQTIFVRQGLVA